MLPKSSGKKYRVFFSRVFLRGTSQLFFCEGNLEFFLEIFIYRVFFSVLYFYKISRFSVYRISQAFLSIKTSGILNHYARSATMNTFDIEEGNRHLQVIGAMAATIFILLNGKKYVVKGRTRNRCDADYASVVNKVMNLKLDKPALFTRMYRLSPKAFDEVFNAIQADLMPRKMTATYFVPPMIKLCCAL
jgi:uncharacterized protein YlzI (FlbEa/FlbD family)